MRKVYSLKLNDHVKAVFYCYTKRKATISRQEQIARYHRKKRRNLDVFKRFLAEVAMPGSISYSHGRYYFYVKEPLMRVRLNPTFLYPLNRKELREAFELFKSKARQRMAYGRFASSFFDMDEVKEAPFAWEGY